MFAFVLGGRELKLLANFFRLKTPKDRPVYDYHVTFEPNIEAYAIRRAMLRRFADRLETHTFDGDANLKSLTKYPLDVTEFSTQDSATNTDVKITVTFTGEVGWTGEEFLRLFNVIMRRNLEALKYVMLDRRYFDPQKKINIPEHNISMWQGVVTAIHQFDAGLLMMCDTAYKGIFQI